MKQYLSTITIIAVVLTAIVITIIFTACGKKETFARIETNFGNMTIALFTDQAPETTKNFIELSKQGKYNGTIFHRVIKDFMIQGGDFENGNGTGGYTYKGPGTTLKDEIDPDLKHEKGTVSMANRGPNTSASQFFIVQAEDGAPWLDGGYTIFGKATSGLDIVDKIANVKTGEADRPLEDVIVKKIEIIEE